MLNLLLMSMKARVHHEMQDGSDLCHPALKEYSQALVKTISFSAIFSSNISPLHC